MNFLRRQGSHGELPLQLHASLLKILIFSFIACFLLPVSSTHATFTDEIGVEVEEVFEAAKSVLSAQAGLKKVNAEKYELVSKWQYDEVERRRGILRHFIKKLFKRRYRMHVQVGPGEHATELDIRAYVEEKSRTVSPSIPWKKAARMDRHDLRLERALFDDILAYLAENKMKAASSEVTSPEILL